MGGGLLPIAGRDRAFIHPWCLSTGGLHWHLGRKIGIWPHAVSPAEPSSPSRGSKDYAGDSALF